MFFSVVAEIDLAICNEIDNKGKNEKSASESPGVYFTKAQKTDFCGQKSYFSGVSLVLRENSTVSAEPVLFG